MLPLSFSMNVTEPQCHKCTEGQVLHLQINATNHSKGKGTSHVCPLPTSKSQDWMKDAHCCLTELAMRTVCSQPTTIFLDPPPHLHHPSPPCLYWDHCTASSLLLSRRGSRGTGPVISPTCMGRAPMSARCGVHSTLSLLSLSPPLKA